MDEPGRASIEAFLADLAHQRMASPLTVAAYRRDLDALLALAGNDAPQTLLPHVLRRGMMQLHGRGLGARSIARALAAWRSYYRWLARRGEIARNPADGLRAPKQPRPLPKALGADQTQVLLDAPAEEVLDVRDKAMAELFYSSGLRLAELASLDIGGGLDLDEGEVTVT
ncbi:tyrosine recombinase XerC, partial [bacterium]|nr:tyrosine recombinase XerC [bacterium]